MIKMASQLENIVNAYKTLSKIPSIAGAKLNKTGNRVTAKWSVRNFDKGKSTKYITDYVLDDGFNVVAQSDFGTDVSNELLSAVSPQETYKAVIREEKTGKDAKKQYLEVWKKSCLAHCIDLTTLDMHGDVYADSEFGSLDWSADESSLVYIAERKQKKSEAYIKRKGEEKSGEGNGDTSEPKKGEEFLYRQDWGEQLVGKFSSVIVVCRIESETLTVLDQMPTDCCPGQVRFSADGANVVGVAWETQPRRLGLIFCTNRPSVVFSVAVDPKGVMYQHSRKETAVRSPRVSPRGELVWLQRGTGGPHHGCMQLRIMRKGAENAVETPVIDFVQTETKTANNEPFHGLFNQALPANCFSNEGDRIVLSTAQKTEVKSYVVDLESGNIVDISIKVAGSTSVLDVKNDVILASHSSMTSPGQLYVGRLPSKGNEADISWVRITEPIELPASVVTSRVEYLNLEHEDSADDVKSFSAIYLAPKSEEGKKLPLIVWPHGGPHSNFVNAYSLETSMFNMLGFAALLINYRGSSGTGESSITFLPRRVGNADVKDCKLATDVAVQKFPVDGHKMVLFGGSHGGFLVTHLSGQYPDVYKAVVSRNPVTDVATMFNYTDINDCSDGYRSRTEVVRRFRNVRSGASVLIYAIGADSFTSLQCNYRGSTGFGDANVRSLIGRVGNYDVADCYLALTTVLKRDATSHVVLKGGSYGGLVVGHLAAKYPDLFKAMAMRNPLIDLATKAHCADNFEGCAVEAGFEFTEKGPLSEEELLALRRCSPLAHVHKVTAPTALMLGSGDKRVPCYQGLEYARRLKANGVETRVYMYDDNHSLSSQPAEMDNLINSADWFLSHIYD